jgi:hypothetical protein
MSIKVIEFIKEKDLVPLSIGKIYELHRVSLREVNFHHGQYNDVSD